MSKDEIVAVVDEQDNILELKSRSELTVKDIIRVSVLWLENSRGETLMQQRSLTKAIGPGQWGPAVAGTVEAHETYLTNIIKEAEEEIGLVGFTPIEVGKRMFWESNGGFGRVFTFYKAQVDKPIEEFIMEPGQVERLEWVPKVAVFDDVDAHPAKYVPSAVLYRELFS